MNDTSNRSEFRSFTRARQIAVAATMLHSLTLAAPPRLWAHCDPSWMLVPTLTVSPGGIMGVSTQTATGTVTVSNIGSGGAFVPINVEGLGISSPNFWFGE